MQVISFITISPREEKKKEGKKKICLPLSK
jgi:hypothetical protein